MKKEEARRLMKELRGKLSDRERREYNEVICRKVLALPVMEEAEWFFPFVSYGTEVDTLGLIDEVLRQGKRKVALPRVEGREMEFYRIHSREELAPGYRGILEPVGMEKAQAEHGVMLLPGLAFDLQGNRVGYGGGYYDRYLGCHRGAGLCTVAVAYDFQVVEWLEAEGFDQRPDMLVTEKRIFSHFTHN